MSETNVLAGWSPPTAKKESLPSLSPSFWCLWPSLAYTTVTWALPSFLHGVLLCSSLSKFFFFFFLRTAVMLDYHTPAPIRLHPNLTNYICNFQIRSHIMRYTELGLQYPNLDCERGDRSIHSAHSAHRAPSVWNLLASLITFLPPLPGWTPLIHYVYGVLSSDQSLFCAKGMQEWLREERLPALSYF